MARKKTARRTGPRASWRGLLRLNLVSMPVQAFNAAAKREGEVHFHQLHEECHSRIRYEKVCPVHGPIPNDEIVMGYEYARGRYVEFEEEELDQLRTKRDKALTINTFVKEDDIDPIYFDGRVYYLVPDGEEARDPYSVLNAAMEKQQRHGIGQIVFSGREQLVLVRPLDGMLAMQMLNYDNQIRTPEMFEDRLAKRKPSPKEVQMAERLIEASTDDEFRFEEYEDEYVKKVHSLINAKVQGKDIVAPPFEEDEPEVINLMDALRRSVEQAQGGGRHGSRRKRPAARGRRTGSRRKRAAS